MKGVPDERYDWVISTAVLEHVADPWSAVREMLRVAKTGGYIYTLVPFSQIVHYEPRYSDYWRFTPKGLETLFAGAALLEVEIMGDNPARPNGFAVLVQKGAAPTSHSAYWIEFPNELPWQIYLDEPQMNFDWSVYRMLVDPMSLAHQIHNLRNQYGLQAKLPVLYDDVMRQCKPQYARRFGTLGYRDGTSFLDRVPV